MDSHLRSIGALILLGLALGAGADLRADAEVDGAPEPFPFPFVVRSGPPFPNSFRVFGFGIAPGRGNLLEGSERACASSGGKVGAGKSTSSYGIRGSGRRQWTDDMD